MTTVYLNFIFARNCNLVQYHLSRESLRIDGKREIHLNSTKSLFEYDYIRQCIMCNIIFPKTFIIAAEREKKKIIDYSREH